MIYALAGLAALIAVGVIILAVRDRATAVVWRFRNPPEKIEAKRRAFVDRLERPDWAHYEKHLGREVPPTLRKWFDSHANLSVSYHFNDYYVAFSPIDGEGENEASWVLPGILPIADSDGDPIFLKPGRDEPNTVHIAYHDGGGTEQLAPSVEEFLSALKHDTYATKSVLS